MRCFSLLGASSPLPYYLSVETNQAAISTAWFEFVDIFNQYFWQLRFNLWEKYRPIFHRSNHQLHSMFHPFISNKPALSDYVKFFLPRAHHSNGLAAMIKQYYQADRVVMKPFQASRMPMHTSWHGGELNFLGQHYLRANGVAIKLYLSGDSVRRFISQTSFSSLFELLSAYMLNDCHIKFNLYLSVNQPTVLALPCHTVPIFLGCQRDVALVYWGLFVFLT